MLMLALAGSASASRPATTAELHWMERQALRGHGALRGQTRPTYGFLLHRRRTTARSPWQLLAQAQLRPPYRPEITRLCRAEPRPVRRDLLAAICR
jgi:hypothetical protein